MEAYTIISDAGRSKSKRSKQKNDCTVRAVVEVTGLPYDEVYDILAEAGRKCGRGFEFRKWATNAVVGGYKFEWISFPAVKGKPRMNPATFVHQYPTGAFIIKTAGHVNAVIDGKLYDTFVTYDERCIYGAWNVVKVHDAGKYAERIAIIKRVANKAVMEELNFLCEMDREDPEDYNLVFAFENAWEQLDGQEADFPRSYVDNMREVAIALKWFVPVSDEELERTISTCKKYAWCHKKVKYKFNDKEYFKWPNFQSQPLKS